MPPIHLIVTTGLGIVAVLGNSALALPPHDDIPEEILRTEIITEARSPLNGEPISAADYAALQEHLRDPNTEPVVNPEIAQLIQLLQLRRTLKPILPFLR
ncbi:hypothetical protein VB780_14315 [Leptolyngbya sp. CCNP1308]|uniref:hypothetical protein n=1 Tax=Leptolyngbya sp. CCNP1308 TaxID=3110255 RepID=UPI002B206B23|nr:hypothetical protein [Leptolyngbya sp. CCNP1308]MEA5449753.1 hypothetical protein [Leptolyngbya sp. CCNP1308]